MSILSIAIQRVHLQVQADEQFHELVPEMAKQVCNLCSLHSLFSFPVAPFGLSLLVLSIPRTRPRISPSTIRPQEQPGPPSAYVTMISS